MAVRRKRSTGAQWVVLILVLLAAAVATLIQRPGSRAILTPREGSALGEAKSWGYQLQKLYPRSIPAGIDVLVVDYSRDGGGASTLSPALIEQLRSDPQGRRRIVLCYLSIGEAEDYRYYWMRHWKVKAPAWLGKENAEWKGNYPVQFWDPAWQRIIYRPSATLFDIVAERILDWRKPYLDRIIEMGFDGVYLDRVDVFQEWEKTHKNARLEMISLVTKMSAYAKARKPGFLIVPQNAEELLSAGHYRKAIDGIAKEDLLYGIGGDETENEPGDVAKSVQLLNKARADGLPVFAVEYLASADKRLRAQRELVRLGYVPLFAQRTLSSPPQLVPPLAAPSAAGAVQAPSPSPSPPAPAAGSKAR